MVLNPFKSSKWRHRSTTIEMKDEVGDSPPAPSSSSPPPPPPKNNSKQTIKVPFNSDSVLDGIGDYVFQSPIGGGKFSKVMLAKHYLTGNEVAIKIINKRAHMYRVMSRLVREITLMEILDHENIVRLYETYETADALYIVMEYVQGYNLEEYLKTVDRGIIPEHQARDIFRQVVKAVDHCHSKWIVHRDLKTPNILLTPNEHKVKIADFGLGNRFGLQRLNTVCGSMLYYSPEIISAKSYFGPEVDTWCLGIMLFRMTAGLELFSHAKTSSELKKYITSRHYTFPPHLSPELQTTIQKCLSIDRYDRLSLKSFLSTDPWFNNFGALTNIFDERIPNTSYNANEATEAYIESLKSEDSNRKKYSAQHSKLKCKQDLQEEKKRTVRVPKTVIYHIFNPSTYFTGPAPHSSLNPIDLEGQSQVIVELNENLLVTLKQNKVHQIHDLKTPISQLFRKLKPQQHQQLRKSSSALNLSHLYQRVKDHTCYYSMQCHVHTDSSTTVISGFSSSSTFVDRSRHRLSHRLSMMFFSNTLPELNLTPTEERYPSEMIKIIRSVCEILGITYYQTSTTQLVCLLTLRNCKKKPQQPSPLYRSKLFTSTDSMHNKKQSSFLSSNTSTQSTLSNNWFSRQVHRLSAPFNSQSILMSSAAILGNSSHDLSRWTQQEIHLQQDTNEDEKEDPEGYAVLNIDAFHVPSKSDIVGTRYSKVKGSNKVFKLAKGWIQMLLSQQQQQQVEKPFTTTTTMQQPIFNENDIIQL